MKSVWKTIDYIEGWIKAECRSCGNVVEFASKKLKKKYKNAGSNFFNLF